MAWCARTIALSVAAISRASLFPAPLKEGRAIGTPRLPVLGTLRFLHDVQQPPETVAYDVNGRVQAVSNTAASWTYGWSLSGTTLTATVTDPLLHQRITTADTNQVALLTDKDALLRTTTYQYDGNGRLTYVIPPEGTITAGAPTAGYIQYAYDARGNVTNTTNVSKTPGAPANIVTSANYSTTCTSLLTCNKPNYTIDANGNETDYAYDPVTGLMTSVTAPAPTTGAVRPQTRYSYTPLYAYYKNSAGSVVAAATPIYKLTSVSSCVTTASCAGTADEVKTAIGYGPQVAGTLNNLLPVSASKGSGDGVLTATTSTVYDMVGNVYTVDGPLSGTADTTRYRFNAGRQLVGVVGPDPDGAGALKYRALRYSYNLDGQAVEVEQGTVNSQSDPDWSTFNRLQVALTNYDSLGRKEYDAFADDTFFVFSYKQYSYDVANRLDCTAVRMNRGAISPPPASACTPTVPYYGGDRIAKYNYDAANQLTSLITAYGVAGVQRTEVTNTYTNNGKLATAADARNNLSTYSYDGFDRLVKTQFPSPTAPGTSSTTDYEQLTYDPSSNVTQDRRRDGLLIGFAYDHLNRLITKNLPGSEPDVTLGYDNLGRLTSASQTGNALSFSYDALGRNINQTGPLGTMVSQYDLAGRRTRLTWPDAFYVTYDYDLLNEMTAVRENGAMSGAGVLATIAYDDLGHRTSLTRGNGTVTSYGYDTTSHLTSLTQDLAGTASDQTQTFSYNPANQIYGQTKSNDAYAFTQSYVTNRSYTPNGLNQYTAAGAATATYDGRGNLTALTGPSTKSFGYSSENLLTAATGASGLSYDSALRLYQVSAGATTRFAYDGHDIVGEYDASNALQRRYVFGPGTDEPLVWYEGSGTSDRRWLHSDERGSITAITNGAGNPIAINSYDEYGVPATGNIGRFQYTGQAWLPEIGLYYYKARIYSPSLGRFLQSDPVGYSAGMNLYAYAGADPVNGTDPSGTDDSLGGILDVFGDAGGGFDFGWDWGFGGFDFGIGGTLPYFGGGIAGIGGGGSAPGNNSSATKLAAKSHSDPGNQTSLKSTILGIQDSPPFGEQTANSGQIKNDSSSQSANDEIVVEARYLRQAVITALNSACGCTVDPSNFLPLNPNFVKVVDPNKLPKIFKGSLSAHAKAFSTSIPGSNFVLKFYSGDTDNGGLSTLTITTPLSDPEHYVDFLFSYSFGDPINSYYARQYCLSTGHC